MTVSAGSREYLLALADDEHLMGQRHTEWIGVAPFLEEDLAFASIGQDELGHAAMLYELLVGDDDLDTLALRRDPDGYRSCWLVEQECRDWSDALVRHWLYDAAEELRWELLAASPDADIAGVADRALREESFHRRHADALLDSLLTSDAARDRLSTSLTTLLPLALGVFEPPAGETAAIEEGLVSSGLAELVDVWRSRVVTRFGPQDWDRVSAPDQQGRTLRSDAFGPMYDAMREVLLIDPAAVW